MNCLRHLVFGILGHTEINMTAIAITPSTTQTGIGGDLFETHVGPTLSKSFHVARIHSATSTIVGCHNLLPGVML